jgi:hypothetical protein
MELLPELPRFLGQIPGPGGLEALAPKMLREGLDNFMAGW